MKTDKNILYGCLSIGCLLMFIISIICCIGVGTTIIKYVDKDIEPIIEPIEPIIEPIKPIEPIRPINPEPKPRPNILPFRPQPKP